MAEFCSGSWWSASTIPHPPCLARLFVNVQKNNAGRVFYSGQSKPREALLTCLHLRVRYPERSGRGRRVRSQEPASLSPRGPAGSCSPGYLGILLCTSTPASPPLSSLLDKVKMELFSLVLQSHHTWVKLCLFFLKGTKETRNLAAVEAWKGSRVPTASYHLVSPFSAFQSHQSLGRVAATFCYFLLMLLLVA